MKETVMIEHPLYARGIVLKDSAGTYVLCAVDLCGLCNDSYELFRTKIAAAANTKISRVAVQSLHQHTAPVYDANAREILYRADPKKLKFGLQFANQSAKRISKAIQKSMSSFQTVTHIGTSKARVQKVASNRRVEQPDGTILTRLSSTKDPKLQAAPEGIIDPWLRTISFYNQDQPIVQLHYFATHPQSYYGDGRITSDVPGIALLRLQKKTGVAQVYFTGCAGNVGMGKYNTGSRSARGLLVDRLYNAMFHAATTDIEKHLVVPILWSTKAIQFPLRAEAEFLKETQQQIIASPSAKLSIKLKAAMLLAWIERCESGRAVELSRLSIGKVQILNLPGEPFVQFQLAAQKFASDKFVAVAGYGDCAMWYLGEDRIYTDIGGYEQTWAFTGPCEELMQKAVQELLQTH